MKFDPSIRSLSKKLTSSLLCHYKPSSKIIPQIAKYIEKHNNFILTTHISCDMDGVGSEYALYMLLKKMNKKCIIINNEEIPEIIQPFIDTNCFQKIEEIKDTWQHVVELLEKDYFAFILDCSELPRIDLVGSLIEEAKCPWKSIDHHVLPANKNYLVDASYGATCEIIWDLYHYFKIKIPSNVAVPLYLGLVTDTGNFRYSKTSLRTHLAAGELTSYGIDTDYICRLVYENHTFDRLQVMKQVFNKAIFNKEKGYVIGEIIPDKIKKLQLNDSFAEGIVNHLLGVQGVYISALLKKTENGFLKASLRSIEDIDVASIASEFGGGGHKNAAGLYLKEPYKKAKKKLVQSIHKYLS